MSWWPKWHCPDVEGYRTCRVCGWRTCTRCDGSASATADSPHCAVPPDGDHKVSFLRPLRANAGEIEARGQALKAGRRVAFAQARARDQSGELAGHATTSPAINRP